MTAPDTVCIAMTAMMWRDIDLSAKEEFGTFVSELQLLESFWSGSGPMYRTQDTSDVMLTRRLVGLFQLHLILFPLLSFMIYMVSPGTFTSKLSGARSRV